MSELTQKNILKKPVTVYYLLLASTAILSLFGLIMVFSASSIYSLENKGTTYAIIFRQVIFLILSVLMTVVLSRFSLSRWKSIARYGALIAIILLAIVQIPKVGKSVNGNHNWISLGFVDVQPSEVAKFLIIL